MHPLPLAIRSTVLLHCSARPESRSLVWKGQRWTGTAAWSCMQKNGEQAPMAQSNLQMAFGQLSPAAVLRTTNTK